MVTERLVPEGNWFRLVLDTLEFIFNTPTTTLEEYIMLIHFSSLIGECNKITDDVRCGDN